MNKCQLIFIVGTNLYLANGDLTLFLSLIFVFVGLNKLDYVILLLMIRVGVFNRVCLSGVFILELLFVFVLLFDNFRYFIFQLSADYVICSYYLRDFS